jgi:hypothetical protein
LRRHFASGKAGIVGHDRILDTSGLEVGGVERAGRLGSESGERQSGEGAERGCAQERIIHACPSHRPWS